MPEPATVWLVRPGIESARRGTLSLSEEWLGFIADDGERIRVAASGVDRVRRMRGTPVLEVRYRRDGERRILLFFFVEPPPLYERSTLPRPGARGMHRLAVVRRLRTANRPLRAVIEGWARAIGKAAGR